MTVSPLNRAMLSYLLAMPRAEQEAIPSSRVPLIAWLGTEEGIAWLMASPLRDEIVARDLGQYLAATTSHACEEIKGDMDAENH
jgi:hypothetical protein